MLTGATPKSDSRKSASAAASAKKKKGVRWGDDLVFEIEKVASIADHQVGDLVQNYDLRDIDQEGGSYAGDDSPEQEIPAERGRVTTVFSDEDANAGQPSEAEALKMAFSNDGQPSEAEAMREAEDIIKIARISGQYPPSSQHQQSGS